MCCGSAKHAVINKILTVEKGYWKMNKAAFIASFAAVLTIIFYMAFKDHLIGIFPVWFIYGAPIITSALALIAMALSFVEKTNKVK